MKFGKVKFDPHKHLLMAKDNCKKCYGRGYIGKNLSLNIKQPCTCLFIVAKPEEKPEEKP